MTAAPDPPAPMPVPRGPIARILRNLGHLLSGKAAAGIISLLYLVIVTRTLRAEGYGVLVLINAYAVLIGSLVAFSGFHGAVRYGALALERGDREGLARIMRFMAVVELGCGAAAILVAAALAPLVGPRLGWSPSETRAAILYSLAVCATVRATPQGLLQLAGRFDLVGLHQIVSPLARLAGVLIAWGSGAGLTGFLLAWLAAALAEGLAMWLLAARAWSALLPGERLRGPWRGAAGENDGFARFILATNLNITLREIMPQAVPLTIGWLAGPAAAGLFALALRATNVLQQPAVLLEQGSYAVLADLVAKGGGRPLEHAVWRSTLLVTFASLAILGLLVLVGGRLLIWIGGASFVGGTTLMLLVAVSRAFTLAATPLAAGLTALGRPGLAVIATLLAMGALYPLLPWLLLTRGIDGAGWHAVIQNVAGAGLLALFFVRAKNVRA